MLSINTLFKKKYVPKLHICKDSEKIGQQAAEIVIKVIRGNSFSILGLATGSSPIPLYNALIEDHKKNKTDYLNIKSFNLDEYVDLSHKYFNQSYRNFMDENLFNKININKNNTFFPSLTNYQKYDEMIKKAGGIDVQILGLGVNGHIAFNEPGTPITKKTHIVKITESTREANARFFDNKINNVPKTAITMGIKTILKAKKIILIATGKNKALAISKLFENKYDKNWPVTSLLFHPDVTVFVDLDAAFSIK